MCEDFGEMIEYTKLRFHEGQYELPLLILSLVTIVAVFVYFSYQVKDEASASGQDDAASETESVIPPHRRLHQSLRLHRHHI